MNIGKASAIFKDIHNEETEVALEFFLILELLVLMHHHKYQEQFQQLFQHRQQVYQILLT